VNIAVAALFTVAVLISMVVWGSRPEYTRLYDNLDPSETAKIIELCQQEKVSYRLENNDRTILVPLKDRSRMKMAASGKGLPTSQGSAPGFELFKEQDIMSSRWLQDVKYMRAVQGELQRQLNEFDFVNKSLVWISEAKEELFAKEQKPSKASVTLDTKRDLSSTEIRAVLHTISSFGGTNLDLDHITLVTSEGKLLHAPKDNDFDSIASSKFEHQGNIEKRAEARAQEALDRVGVQSVVRVSAKIDYDQSKEVSTKSEDGALLSSMTNTTNSRAQELLPKGAPGLMTNIPEDAKDGATAGTGEETEYSVQNYEPSITKKETTRSGGTVKQFIVTALVSGETVKSQDANGTETSEYVPLTEEKKKTYEQLLLAAVGEGEMPTQVKVEDHPLTVAGFGGGASGPNAETGISWSGWQSQSTWLIQLAVIFVGLMIVRRLLRRAILTPVRTVDTSVAAFERPTASAEDVRREEVSAEVARMSQDNPEAVVALLRSWMNEEE